MTLPTSDLTGTPASSVPLPRPTARDLWTQFVRETWICPVQAISLKTRLPKTSDNPLEWMAREFQYAGYRDGVYTVSAGSPQMRDWARVMLAAKLGRELAIVAARRGMAKAVSVEFISREEAQP